MSFLSTILNFFGTKSDRDMKELVPVVKEILTHDTYFTNLSNNQQAFILKHQQKQQKILSTQAAENAARQFNATSENQTNHDTDC